MSRYTGPKARIARRLGANLFGTEGERKALDKRPYPPGDHGRTRRMKESEYRLQLLEKQKARFTYGLTEKQFARVYAVASRKRGVTGTIMLQMLEMRLDNVVYRCGWGSTRPQARQFVGHGFVAVNGKRVDIPSYRVRKGDVITLVDKVRERFVIRQNLDTLDRTPPPWITKDSEHQVTIYDVPLREHIDIPVREQLIVEYYSK